MSGTGHRTLRRQLWIAAYVVALLCPLVLLATAPSRGAERDALFGIALGFVGLMSITLQLVVPSRHPAFTAEFGVGPLIRFHRAMGFFVLFIVVLHATVFILRDDQFLAWLNPFHGPLKGALGAMALWSLVLLIITTLARRRFHLGYEPWRIVHALTGCVLLVGASVHALLIGWYSTIGSLHWLAVAALALGLVSIVYLRWFRPFGHLALPYVVAEVRPERGGATTLQLEAVGHDGIGFLPGQFAWLKVDGSTYMLAEHPFSFASSARDPRRPSFTMRARGDFTSSAGDLRPGTRVLLDAPHGEFEPTLPDAGFLFVVAGIGVTPAMSFLRTFADAGDQRPITLLYGARTWADVTFREELEHLAATTPLDVTIVVSRPDPEWGGVRGRLDSSMVTALLPPDVAHRNCFVCGPPEMISDAVRALRSAGVPEVLIHADRFDGA